MWLRSEYASDISCLLKSTLEYVRILCEQIYGLKTATFKMELSATIVNGFYVLSVAC